MSDQRTTARAGIEIRLLGPFEVSVSGRPAALGGQRQRAVLARLALAFGDVVTVERLIEDLWAGDPPPSALNTVQSYVSNLRRAIGSGGSVVERIGPGYRIAVDPDTIDLHRFALAAARAAAPDLDALERIEMLDHALDLWRGPALVDFADADWAQADIVRLEELRLSAIESRFDTLIDEGRHAGIVGELEQAVRDHPLRERFCHQLMLALYRSGRQADALRAYERTRTHLGDEVGLDPGPELQRLAGAILEHDAWLDEPDRPSPDTTTTGPADRTDTAVVERQPLPELLAGGCPALQRHRGDAPFVGRTDAVDWLTRHWDEVCAGAPAQVVVVAGEAGIGKTRLLQHVAVQVEGAGGVVLWGRCTADPDVVFQPMVDALQAALADTDPAHQSEAVAARPGLTPLLPAVGRRHPAVERLEVYEAAADLLRELAGDRPMLLVVDDAQWADSASLHLIEQLLDRRDLGRLLVALTVRRPAGQPTKELDRLTATLRRAARLRELDLSGISAAEVGTLLGAMGERRDDERIEAVHARTGGNPFFVQQLAAVGGDGNELPETVRDILDARVNALGDRARPVLLAAAVLGARAELEMVGAVTGVGPSELLDLTDAATDAGVLVEDAELGWIAFPHALVRQAILASATRNRLARLHLLAGESFERRPARPSTVGAVARHLLAAGPSVALDRRAQAVLAAAEASLRSMAPEVALEWIERLGPLLLEAETLAEDLTAACCRGHLVSAAAHRHLGDRAASSTDAWQAVDCAREVGDPRLLARSTESVALSVAGIGFDIGEVDSQLLALIDESLAAIGDAPSAERAMLLAWSAAARAGLDDQRRIADSAAALQISETLGDPAAIARAGLSRRLSLAGPFALDQRLALSAPTRAAAAEAGDIETEVLSLVLDVVDLLESGDVDGSDDRRELLRARLAPLGRPSADAYLHFLDGNAALLRGDLGAAEQAAAAGIATGEGAHGGNAIQAWAAQMFLLSWSRGRLAELAPVVEQMAVERPSVPVWRVAHLATLVAAGDPIAPSMCRATGDGVRSLSIDDAQWSVAVALLGEIAWAVGDEATGATVAELLAPFVDRVTVTAMGAACLGHLHRAHGLALAASGDLDRALASIDAAVRAARRAGFHTWLARSLRDRGDILTARNRRGDVPDARRSLDEATTLGRRLGVSLTLAPPR